MGKNKKLLRFKDNGFYIFSLCFLFLLVGCKQEAASQAVAVPVAKPSYEKRLADYVDKLPLEEKVGQMMFVGIPGTEYDATAKKLVEECHAGGVIHFDRNLSEGAQVQALNSALQAGAKSTGAKIPLFISVDQEGGQVARMRDTLLVAPSAASLGAQGQPAVVREWAVKTAQNLKSYGFNTNFAPVADLGLTAQRSYGNTPAEVIPMVEAAMDGYRAERLMCSIKHFPGIGKMQVDPHYDTSAINVDRAELESNDMLPFLTMVNKKIPASYMIMVSHPVYPAFDREPASVSKVLLTDVLRTEWQYNGIIITDDMAMGGLTSVYSQKEMGVKAVAAGEDMLLSCSSDPTMSYTIYNSVLEAVRQGKLSEAKINASVVRILAAKEAIGIWHLDTDSGIK